MAVIRICDICESRKTVKIIGFKLSNHEEDYEELDICHEPHAKAVGLVETV